MRLKAIPIAIAAVLAVAACSQGDRPEIAASSSPPESPAAEPATNGARLALALAAADRAAEAGDRDALEQSLAAIDRLGGKPADDAARSRFETWVAQRPVGAIPFRGRALGPGYRTGTIGAGETKDIEQTFLSGQRASIALSSPNGRTLRLGVTTSKEKPVCRKLAAQSSCNWVPVFTDRHHITVSNPGRAEARYYLVIE